MSNTHVIEKERQSIPNTTTRRPLRTKDRRKVNCITIYITVLVCTMYNVHECVCLYACVFDSSMNPMAMHVLSFGIVKRETTPQVDASIWTANRLYPRDTMFVHSYTRKMLTIPFCYCAHYLFWMFAIRHYAIVCGGGTGASAGTIVVAIEFAMLPPRSISFLQKFILINSFFLWINAKIEYKNALDLFVEIHEKCVWMIVIPFLHDFCSFVSICVEKFHKHSLKIISVK